MQTVLLYFFDFSGILHYWNKSDDFWDSLRSSQSFQSSESVSTWSLQNLQDRPDRTQLYPSNRGCLSHLGRLRLSQLSEHYLSKWDDRGNHMETRLKNSCSYQFTHDWPTWDECTLLTECNNGESLILRFKILHNFLWCKKHEPPLDSDS